MESVPQSPRTCSKCGKTLHANNKSGTCTKCNMTCSCGRPKSFDVPRCYACRATPIEDLTCESFYLCKDSGRYLVARSDENGKVRRIFRYRWLWEQANGPIPEGYYIHHVNGDKTDDRLENMQMLTNSEHSIEHMIEARLRDMLESGGKEYKGRPIWNCAHCRKEFYRKRAGKNREYKYCSHECYIEAQFKGQGKVLEWVCLQCGMLFHGRKEHGRDRLYCSRECSSKASKGKTKKRR